VEGRVHSLRMECKSLAMLATKGKEYVLNVMDKALTTKLVNSVTDVKEEDGKDVAIAGLRAAPAQVIDLKQIV